VWSCRVVSDSDFSVLTNRFATAHAKSQDHRASCEGFFFWRLDRQGALANWLAWAEPEKHRTPKHPGAKCEQR
jgi:hypothetical protein